MTKTRPVRTRTTLVAATAAVVVVTATASVSAHEGDEGPESIHACVASSGSLRVLSDPGGACRSNETPLHWAVGSGSSGAEELDAFKLQLLATDNVSDLVDWSNLQGVPQWVVDGLPEWLQDGAVDGSEVVDDSLISADLRNGSVLGEDLGEGAVTGRTVADGSLTAADLAGSYGDDFVVGAVTGEKIADGSVEPRDLLPEVSSTVPGAPVALSAAATDLGSAVVPAAAGSMVMVSGQVQLSWAGACPECSDVVTYQLTRGDVGIGPVYRTQLSVGHAEDVAGVAFLDSVTSDGTHRYGLRLSTVGSPVGISASDLVLTAQVLGAD